tara:strand:- start:51 stop:635 length:585 start_codon:yes stop_codon:yes gene_type:complete
MGGTVQMSKEEFAKFKANPGAFEKFREGLNGENLPVDDDAELDSIAAAGHGYAFGIPPATLATISYLQMVDSPFVDQTREPVFRDIALSAYIICEGGGAMSPVFAAKRMEAAVDRQGTPTDPELYSVYLDQIARIQSAYGEIEAAAHCWFADNVPTDKTLEVLAAVQQSVQDFFEAFNRAGPGEDDNAEKKTTG